MSCYIWSGFSLVDMTGLTLTDSNYEATDDDGNTYYFNFCSYVVETSTVSKSCDGSSSVYAYESASDSSCYDLTDNEISSLTSSVTSNSSVYQVNFNYTNGEYCNDAANYSFGIMAYCDVSDSAASGSVTINSVIITDECAPIVNLTTADACPLYSLDAYTDILATWVYIFAVIMVILGAAILFFGRQFFTYTIFILGFVLGLVTTYILFIMTNILD